MEIKVVGSGCTNCKNVLARTQQAVKEMGVEAEILYITDMEQIIATGILQTPGLMINGKVKSAGRVPSVKDIKKLIESEI
ncbi:MAG: thioredoxin family protein [Clostridia bacterium]|nr:thioredoxin family protein [Clostridia bacterium]NCC75575.1 thioredoxin family protein [Clostridia bacterium]